ncbi:DNA primase [Candidatus Woesebacteria bacterium RIFOXYD1_FULL_40_21]|uniref:DNA primase n=1 Tax=Candidatus Woesebacteria bacterium RIFOXYD1_FULL_40_21 TaxID=1802549 RepID=A0A1F8DJC9_9BACT|nr:MAG: DNA primase [Candidatus Woesebacteria bacterium RIFOXYD1_FULL_40_21]
MADQVDEIKQKVDIVSLIGEHIELKKAGRNYRALCPFHSEKTPSFMVSPELQMYKCFGCGEGGDVFTFLEKYEGMEFREALKFLADKTGIKLVSFRPGEESQKERLYELHSLASKFYSYVLLAHRAGKAALKYLTDERDLDLETIKFFQIGFSPNVPGVISKFLVDKKHFNLKELAESGIGIIKGERVFDKFGGRIIFPLFDHRGNIAGFAGRILPEGSKELAKYINSPETPIYHKSRLLFGLNFAKEEIKRQGAAIIVEGEVDMISSYQRDVKNVVAIKGSALTEDQVKLLSRFTKKIILALDSDFAGDVAARRGIVIAQKEGLEITVAKMGEFKDPDDAVRKNPQFFKKAIVEAVGVWDFIIDSIFSRGGVKTGEEKAKLSREIVPVLASIPDRIVQAHYIEQVAKRLGVPEEAVNQEVEEHLSQKKEQEPNLAINTKEKVSLETKKTRRQLLEERLLSLAFQSEPSVLESAKIKRLMATSLPKRIYDEYLEFAKNNREFSPSAFASQLPKELLSGFAEMVLKETQDFIDRPDLFKREIEFVVSELEVVDMRHKLEVIGAKIREFESSEEGDKLKDAQEKFSELTRKLAKFEEEPQEGIIFGKAKS